MKIEFAFFRQGVDRAEYGLTFDMPVIPRAGDKIVIRRPETADEIYPEEAFVVRRTEWSLKTPVSQDPLKAMRGNQTGTVDMVTVECEFQSGGRRGETPTRS